MEFSSKYTSAAPLLTPSPNPDTDVLLPPPNSFTLAPPTHHAHPLGAMLTRQHARQSSTPSDIEQDTPPGLSPADGGPASLVAPPVPPRAYPGLAVPVLAPPHPEVGHESLAPPRRAESLRHPSVPTSTPSPHSAPFASVAPARPPRRDSLVDGSYKEPTPILKGAIASREVKVHSTTLSDRGRVGARPPLEHAPKPITPSAKSRSISPKKAVSADAAHPSRRTFATHVRSKSSASLKGPNGSLDGPRPPQEEVLLSLKDAYVRSLSTGSCIADLLTRQRQVSPSHTEICLTHVVPPAKKLEKPIRPRGRNGDRLFTSRSLERPSTPRRDRSLTPTRRVVSLPTSRGRSRERSPSPPEGAMDSRRSSFDLLREGGREALPRSLTHEEEIHLVIAGDASLLRKATPDAFPSLDRQSSESVVSNESEYEMRF